MGVSPRVYRPRRPQNTPFYQCLDGYWEEFKEAYPYFYEANYGQLRPVVEKTVDRFLECGTGKLNILKVGGSSYGVATS